MPKRSSAPNFYSRYTTYNRNILLFLITSTTENNRRYWYFILHKNYNLPCSGVISVSGRRNWVELLMVAKHIIFVSLIANNRGILRRRININLSWSKYFPKTEHSTPFRLKLNPSFSSHLNNLTFYESSDRCISTRLWQFYARMR